MIQLIDSLLRGDNLTNLVTVIVGSLVMVNGVLSAVQVALQKLQDIIPGNTDAKILLIISKIVSVLQKIIDFVSANQKH